MPTDVEKTPTELQEERLLFVVGVMRLMWPKWRMKDALQAEYGVSRKEAEQDVHRARAKLREEDDTPRVDKRSKVSAFLEDMIGNLDAADRERLRAVKEYIRLHGLSEQTPMEEEQTENIEIVIPDWRATYQKRLDERKVLSASGNGAVRKKPTADNGTAEEGTKPKGGQK